MGPTVPQLFVRSVETQVTQAALKDMLNAVLSARALLHLLHWHHSIHRQKKNKKQKINTQEVHTVLLCSGGLVGHSSSPNFLLLGLPTNTNHGFSFPETKRQDERLARFDGDSNASFHSTDVSTEHTDWHFLLVSHRLCEWTGHELKNSHHNFYFFILKISC